MRNILLSVFTFCLFFCGSLFLVTIWHGEPEEFVFKVIATSFVTGLTAFLVWFVFTLKIISDRN
jgi:hypothetical protein